MPYYVDADNEVYFYEEEIDDPSLTFITEDEVQEIISERDAERMPESVRMQRDGLLKESDVVIIRYAELGEIAPKDWIEYRQALRDIPQQEGFPLNIVWPEKPDEV